MGGPWRQSIDDYFQTTVSRGSIEERDERIAELITDGFQVVRYFENTVEGRGNQTGLINGRQLIKHSYDGGSTRATYGAVLRRPNARTPKQ